MALKILMLCRRLAALCRNKTSFNCQN